MVPTLHRGEPGEARKEDPVGFQGTLCLSVLGGCPIAPESKEGMRAYLEGLLVVGL